ncbi:MAG: 4Fe-4S dicluster domain-containing protein [Candidatus Kapaibacteriota bacterium]
MNRRVFAKILTTSLFGGFSCKRPEIPLQSNVKPTNAPLIENIIEFNTTFPYYPLPIPISVSIYNRFPFAIKPTDNKSFTRGNIPSFVLASLYVLYDKFRNISPRVNNLPTNLNTAVSQVFTLIDNTLSNKQNIAIITSLSNSKFLNEICNEIENLRSGIKIIQLPHIDFLESQAKASQLFFNRSSLILNDISTKKLIVNFGQDFLQHDALAPYYQGRFNKVRQKLVTFEDVVSLTGLNSNLRIVAEEQEITRFALSVLKSILEEKRLNSILSEFNTFFPNGIWLKPPESVLKLVLENLDNIVFLCNPYFSKEVQLVVLLLNHICNVIPESIIDLALYISNIKKFDEFIDTLQKYNLLIFIDYNPYFSLNRQLVEIIEKDNKNLVQLSIYQNELTEKVKIFIPLQTYFEYWLDQKSPDGKILAQQRITNPINLNSISNIEFFFKLKNHLMGIEPSNNYIGELFNYYFESTLEENFEENLRNGFFIEEKSHSDFKFTPANIKAIFKSLSETNQNTSKFGIKIIPHIENYSGEYSNNPYLRELPDPVFGSSWISPLISHYESSLGETSDSILIDSGKETTKIPTRFLKEINAKTNFIVYRNSFYFNKFLNANIPSLNTNFVNINNDYLLYGKLQNSKTQTDLPMISRISVITSNANFKSLQDVEAINKSTHLNKQILAPEMQWSMVVDVEKCIGCNNCILACQLENNIPIVGETNIKKNRDLLWINVIKVNNKGKIKFYPLMCQHCDNAPCESVCPVGATSHNKEGLNEMTYNQCIGSRICMANCPYGVRRFNFLDPEKVHPNYIPMMMNPFVTVRSRGVTEKCTFCIQRINFGRAKAKLFGDENNFNVKTACQEACPVGAIKFGRKKEMIGKENQQNLYVLLPEFNTKPNVYYEMTDNEKENS